MSNYLVRFENIYTLEPVEADSAERAAAIFASGKYSPENTNKFDKICFVYGKDDHWYGIVISVVGWIGSTGILTVELDEDAPILRICHTCDKPILDEDYHSGHEERCPNYSLDPDDDEWDDKYVDCECDVRYHPGCCPVCNATRSLA